MSRHPLFEAITEPMHKLRIRVTCVRCENTSEWYGGEGFSADQVLQELRDKGWVVELGKGLADAEVRCPKCSGTSLYAAANQGVL